MQIAIIQTKIVQLSQTIHDFHRNSILHEKNSHQLKNITEKFILLLNVSQQIVKQKHERKQKL